MTATPAERVTTHHFRVTSLDTYQHELTTAGSKERQFVSGYTHVTATDGIRILSWDTSKPPAHGAVIVIDIHEPREAGQ
jgi:hypothetical protein